MPVSTQSVLIIIELWYFKHLIDKIFKLLVGEGVAEFTERIGQSPVVPLVLLAILHVKEVPKLITLYGEVTGNSTHIRQLIAHCHDL